MGVFMSKPLTKRQGEIFDFIETYIDENNRPPTIQDIKDTFGFRSPQSVVDHLTALEKKGHIKRIPNSRGIVLLHEKNHFPILGEVAAGVPIAAEECFDGNFSLEDYYKPDRTFVLKVQGESMIEAGIHNGDMVLIEPSNTLETGQIGVFVVDGEYTVKRFTKEKSTIVLKAENTTFKPLVITEEVEDFRIIGRVVGVHRVIR